MEALMAAAIGLLTAGGIYLMLRRRTFPVIIGLSLLSYAVNLFLFVAGRLAPGLPPIISKDRNGLYRSAAAGAGSDGHRDFLRDDGGDRDDGAGCLSERRR